MLVGVVFESNMVLIVIALFVCTRTKDKYKKRRRDGL